ncbi:hypothetical protein D5R81_01080 [Parashewanella spongiae]|uniref:Uncharacterized protein n=1 Tax=Parashewanella spongiae TaxID=342950 RepID=A0A3A6TSZ4_9GAMM|nr:hypothetical protein [Parashewanella spongiae]MCL1077174.1 hypothetical protein [Parashewanella spongiae]RJY19329.1 hypothetical protein D5R81_01080 [Parashewanella spongiae]
MAVITTYPNVPLITTNAATDSIRQDNEHKPNITAAEKATKPHAEREIDPEKEQSEQQSQHSKQQQSDDVTVELSDDGEEHLKDNLPATPVSINTVTLASLKPALSRTDIKVIAKKTQTDQTPTEHHEQPSPCEPPKAEQVKQNLKNIYHDSDEPESHLNTWS